MPPLIVGGGIINSRKSLKPLPRLLHGYNLKNIPKEEPPLLNDMRIISPNLSKGISNVQLRTPKVLKSNGPSPDGIFPVRNGRLYLMENPKEVSIQKMNKTLPMDP